MLSREKLLRHDKYIYIDFEYDIALLTLAYQP